MTMEIYMQPQMTEKDVNDIRSKVQEILDDGKINQRQISDQSGVKYGTLTPWMTGKYTGKVERVAAELKKWLDIRENAKGIRPFIPDPGFIKTPSAEQFFTVLGFAQMLPDMSVIAAKPGLGKTMAIKAYAQTNPNVWRMTAEPSMNGMFSLLLAVGEALGMHHRHYSSLSQSIQARLRNTKGLLIVDEAQHLPMKLLDQLRTFYDLTGVGLALVGNETVYSNIEGEGRRANFAQLASRIGMQETQLGPRVGDAEAIIKAWGISGEAEVKILKAVSQKPGALRSMSKVIKLAYIAAAGADEDVAEKHLRGAYERLNGAR